MAASPAPQPLPNWHARRSPLPGIRHRGPGLLRRQRRALLQDLDRMAVRRAHERHIAVARRPIDRDSGLHQLLASRIDIVHLVGEVAEMPRFAIVFGIPIVGEFDERRLAGRAPLALLDLRLVPFTGAGISTECGIPDFRSPGGIWARMQPIPFDAFVASQEMRNEAWRRRFAMEDAFTGARPGRGHYALASLYHAGKAPGVITQNIDNLHQDSGIAPADVVELHGNTTYAICLGCSSRYELRWVREKFEATGGHAPDCDCGGYI